MKLIITIYLILLVSTISYGQETPTEGRILIVDKGAEPIGGFEFYSNWIERNNKIKNKPDSIKGYRVFIEFTVDTLGNILNERVVKGLGEPFNSEAMRLILSYPSKWRPAEFKGRKIDSKMNITVRFK